MNHGYLEIIDRSKTPRYVRLLAEGVIVGTAGHAHVRVADNSAFDLEHIVFSSRVDGCSVRVNGFSRMPALLQGSPFQQGVVPWGTEIEIEGLRMRVIEKLPDGAQSRAHISRGTWVVIAGLLATGVLLSILPRREPAMQSVNRVPPPLFVSDEACPEGSGPAHYRGTRWVEAALAKAERYPFAPIEGIESVRLFRRAQRCFSASGDAERATIARQQGDRMQRRVEQDYRARVMRLEHALRHRQKRHALAHTQVLRSLLADSTDAYAIWLDALQRALREQIREEGASL